MRHTRAHTANRRSHHALRGQNLGSCEKCKTPKAMHKVCSNCGTYKGRAVLNVGKKLAKKEKKAKKQTNNK
ncbi:MAG: 50S ribosomal protein L32 [Patescibacteria group bacterium]